jgi:hypothetical protein
MKKRITKRSVNMRKNGLCLLCSILKKNRKLNRYADLAVEKVGNLLWPETHEIGTLKISDEDLP